MTFEILLLSTLETQFAASTTLEKIDAWLPMNVGTKGGSFRFSLGYCDLIKFDYTQAQVFTLVQYFYLDIICDQNSTSHSDIRAQIEAFFAGGYIPPPPDPADPDTINGIALYKIDPPDYHKTHGHIIRRYTGICDFTIN